MGFENDIADARSVACQSAQRWLARNFEADLASFDLDRDDIDGEDGYRDWLDEVAEDTIARNGAALICLLGCSSYADRAVDDEFGDEDRRHGTLTQWAIRAYGYDLADYIERHRGDEPWQREGEDDDEEEEEGDDN